MQNRTALYARISEDPLGLERGVTRQLDDGRKLLADRGWTAAGEYVDNDLSALSGKRRPQYQALLEAVAAGQVDRIVTYHPSRLWRNRRERADGIELLKARRVPVTCVKGPELDLASAMGRGMAGLLGEFDTMESEVKGERVARAAEQRALEGRANGAVLYGWRREYDTDQRGRVLGFRDLIDQAEAAVVVEIVDRLLAGDGLRTVVRDLNDRGIPSPNGKTWGTGTVRRLAVRPANVGQRVHGGVVIGPAAWDAIIDPAKHERIHAQLEDADRKATARQEFRDRGAAARRHLLTYGVGRCGVCGGPLRVVVKNVRRSVAKARTPENPDGVVVDSHELYACDLKGCVGRNRARVDAFVHDVAIGRLSRPDAARLLRPTTPAAGVAPEESAHDLRRRLDDAAEDYAAGVLDREQMRRITAALRPKLDAAEAELRAPAEATAPAELAELVGAVDVAERWRALPVGRQHAVLEVLCEVVIQPTRKGAGFDPDSVDIVWLGQA